MKTAILCGGLGTRLSEETVIKPKPMVEIGERPILWHIMQGYAAHGFSDFVLALGYKGEYIKEYFLNYHPFTSDVQVELGTGKVNFARSSAEDWSINMIDTGVHSMTGGRLGRLAPQLRDSGTFMLTYGDGVADVDVSELVAFHKKHGKLATVTAVRPPARFGEIVIDGGQVTQFKEKPQLGSGWINGGFFVMEPEVFDYIDGDKTVLEADPLEGLVRDGQLMAYQHQGFWHCMDTIRDRNVLDDLWQSGDAPWRTHW